MSLATFLWGPLKMQRLIIEEEILRVFASDLTPYEMWKNLCEEKKTSGLKLCKILIYMYRCFNLAFNTPYNDTYSTCKRCLTEIKVEKCLEKKN